MFEDKEVSGYLYPEAVVLEEITVPLGIKLAELIAFVASAPLE